MIAPPWMRNEHLAMAPPRTVTSPRDFSVDVRETAASGLWKTVQPACNGTLLTLKRKQP